MKKDLQNLGFKNKQHKRVLCYFTSLKFAPDVEAAMIVLRLSHRYKRVKVITF